MGRRLKTRVIGDLRKDFRVGFTIKNAVGELVTANLYGVDSLFEAEGIFTEFLEVRQKVCKRAKSSRYLFGGGFKYHSMEWLACHTVNVWVRDERTDTWIHDLDFGSPYLDYVVDQWLCGEADLFDTLK